ncbi:MAG: rhamnan synthesis F family protein [Aurantimonas endophytica]
MDCKIVVFVHVFHPEVWVEMADMLAKSMDRPFSIVMTCPDPSVDLAVPESPYLVSWTRLNVENRGRDVLPFLRAFRQVGGRYEIGLKLHTKRSLHRGDGDAWRRFILESLLQVDAEGLAAPNLFDRFEPVGLVAPRYHLMPLANRMVLNRKNLRAIMAATGSRIRLSELQRRHFVAGTMFWFRRAALEPFGKPELDELFAPEKGQLDGTAAHAAERLFAHVVGTQGYAAIAAESFLDLQAGRTLDIDELRAINAQSLKDRDNPFIPSFRPFWSRHPLLFEAYVLVRSVTFGWLIDAWRSSAHKKQEGRS